ncbi:MAG: phosphoenolpyruvate--protein phosphotransferase [Geminicoccales bacterium]
MSHASSDALPKSPKPPHLVDIRTDELSGARRLLRRLIEVMGADIVPQQRLNRMVSLIASDIVAEVCSAYVMRGGGYLELFATEGLRSEAVHNTKLRVGEGLVGLIAAQGAVFNLSEAQKHPDFAYRPETGEESFHSFLGVPIVHGGRVAGVLVVQNQTPRHYSEEEVEALQIIATVFAEMFASGGLIDQNEFPVQLSTDLGPERLEGLKLVEGVALGQAVLHQHRIEVTRLVATDPTAEADRLDTAMTSLRASVDELLGLPEVADGEQREVIETYRLFAQDAGWRRRMTEAVKSGLTAEAAVRRVQEETRLRMSHIPDPYLRERLHDLDAIADRLLVHLTGRRRIVDPSRLPKNVVLIARTISPTELLEYKRTGKLRGIIVEEGSPTAHVTIIARALAIPIIGRVPNALAKIAPGDQVAVDCDNGQIFVRPGEDVELAFAQSIKAREERRRIYETLREQPALTLDGMRVGLHLNAGFLIDLAGLEATSADGIGLYRTELAFMARNKFPDVTAQTELYSRAREIAGDKPIVFRTLDVGSDKHLPYWNFPTESNPAMGWRSIRMALDRPAVLRTQLRALVRSAQGRPLDVMFPMVAEVAEFVDAKKLLDMELERAEAAGQEMPTKVRVGTMLEVPSLFWQMPALLQRVDFLSVGSNDLMQFLFACDRGNPDLANRYDVLSPSVLCFISELVERCRTAGVSLSICGEIAARPLEAMVMLGLGVRQLSMTPSDVGPVKAMLRSLRCGRLSTYLRQLLELPDRSLRVRLQSYALDHGIQLHI